MMFLSATCRHFCPGLPWFDVDVGTLASAVQTGRPARSALCGAHSQPTMVTRHGGISGRLPCPAQQSPRRPPWAAASLDAVSTRVCSGSCGTFVVRAAMGCCSAWSTVSVVARVVESCRPPRVVTAVHLLVTAPMGETRAAALPASRVPGRQSVPGQLAQVS